MESAGLVGEHRDGHRVLEQAAQVRVVTRAGAGGSAQLHAEGLIAQKGVEEGAVVAVVDLAREMLEEAVELVEVAVGDGEEVRRIGGVIGAPDRAQLDLELVAKPLDSTGDPNELAALELPGQEV